MNSSNLTVRASWLAMATAGFAATLLGLSLIQGISQGQFQIVRSVEEMTSLLLANAIALRLEFLIDFIFLILYGAFFALLPSALKENTELSQSQLMAARATSVALLLTALLDAAENSHILGELALASKGITLSQTQIVFQAVLSQVKFVLSYFGLFMMSFALDSRSTSERLLAQVLRWVQAPLGLAIFVAEPPLLRPLYLCRAVFFVVGMLWIAAVLKRRSFGITDNSLT